MNQRSTRLEFPIHEAVVLTGFTKYMLDYLNREKIFAPKMLGGGGRGVKRRYYFEDIVLLRALHKICINNGKIRHLKDALLKFRDEFGPLTPGQKVDKHLFVQGNELCCFSGAQGGKQIRSGQMMFSFVISLSAVSDEISECIVMEPSGRGFRLIPEMADRAEEERQKIWAPIKLRRTIGGG